MIYENFITLVKELAPGCKPEAIPRWRDFAAECVDSEQFVHFKRTADKNTAVESWLDVLYSGFKAVRKECGLETATAVIDLSLEPCCLYPGEMMQAALCLEKGKNARQIFDKIQSGEIDCIDLFTVVSRREAEGRQSVRERLKSPASGRRKDRER